ncbi:FAD-dependent monooxygenase andE [Fusarium oxysporum f. sp. albedinis]|nr:FAD-dependent monooxygenase andE [Fusarium oxysporum f. sp. albedinis]
MWVVGGSWYGTGEILNEESIVTSNHQTEPVSLLWSNENHKAAFTFSEDDGAPSTPERKPCSLPMLFSDENGESACPQPTHALDGEKITSTHPTKTTGSHFEFEFSSLSQSEVCDGNPGGYLGLASSPPVPDALSRQEATDSKNTSGTLGDVIDEAVRFEFDFSDLVDPNAKKKLTKNPSDTPGDVGYEADGSFELTDLTADVWVTGLTLFNWCFY